MCTEETRCLFLSNWKIAVTENLHCQRKVDSLVEIRLQIPKDLFQEIAAVGKPHKRGQYIVDNLHNLDQFLGNNWHYRVANRQRDFAFIADNKVFFRLSERKPLVEYTDNGEIMKCCHRGFVFVFKFVRGLGNGLDFDQFLES